MTDALVTATLAWFHIFFAIGWLGTDLLAVFVLGPSVRKVSPSAQGEFLTGIVPKIIRFLEIFGGGTLAFGLLLLLSFTNGDLSILSPMNPWGLKISIGMILGLAAFLIGNLGASPAFDKMIVMVKNTPNVIVDRPPEFARLSRRSGNFTLLGLVLLILALVFMVGAGFY